MSENNTRLDRFWDNQSAALVVMLVFIASSRLVITNWMEALSLTQVLTFFSVALGLALGYSIFSRRVSIWLGFGYGLCLILWQLLNIVERSDWLYDDLMVIFTRLFDSLVLFFQSQPVYDPIFFLTFVCIAFWNVGLYSGYQLSRRGSFLGAILPGGLAMLIIQNYDAGASLRVWAFAFYIFAALLLLGRMNYLENQNIWRRARVFFTSEMEGDLSRVALTFAAAAIFIAWMIPSALNSIEPAARAWNDFTAPFRERFEDAVSALESSYRTPSPQDYYGETLALGGNAPTSEQPVFYVKVDRLERPPIRYYWRGRVYDQYVDGRWITSDLDSKSFNPDFDRLKMPYLLEGANATLTVTMNFQRQELMYAPAGTLWINRPSQLMTAPAVPSAGDLFAWISKRGLTAGEAYQLRALLPNPNEEQLRAAGEEYPDWVLERYLQIPEELNPQLNALASKITAGQQTPYDKAQAITAFLRNEIEYVTELKTTPPEGQDPMMWVLFEYKKGFCMYSASAEVMLLRSLGIPARMAVGFAQGKYDAAGRRYQVAHVNAHAWPEVYFPNIGWIEFEPTGNQDPLNRPRAPIIPDEAANPAAGTPPRDTPLNPDDEQERDAPDPLANVDPSQWTFARVMRLLYPALLGALLLLGIFAIQRYSLVERLPLYLEGRYIQNGRKPPNWLTRWSQWAGLMPMQRAFHNIDLSLRWLGKPQPLHATPLERARALEVLLPSAQESIAALQQEHEIALFTASTGNLQRARRAARKILFEAIRVRMRKSNHHTQLR